MRGGRPTLTTRSRKTDRGRKTFKSHNARGVSRWLVRLESGFVRRRQPTNAKTLVEASKSTQHNTKSSPPQQALEQRSSNRIYIILLISFYRNPYGSWNILYRNFKTQANAITLPRKNLNYPSNKKRLPTPALERLTSHLVDYGYYDYLLTNLLRLFPPRKQSFIRGTL